MAFIKNKERKSLIKKINESYGLRKAIIAIEIVALIGFIVVTILCWRGTIKNGEWFEKDAQGNFTNKATTMGICMIVWAAIVAVLGVASLILTFTIKSPKTVKSDMDKLQSSALSGRKVRYAETNTEVNKSRTTFKEKKSK